MEEKDTIHIDGKVIGVIVILLLLVSGTFGLFFLKGENNAHSSNLVVGNSNSRLASATTDGKYSDLPEECRPPVGTDIEKWKEHLGHHAQTQPCLKYFP